MARSMQLSPCNGGRDPPGKRFPAGSPAGGFIAPSEQRGAGASVGRAGAPLCNAPVASNRRVVRFGVGLRRSGYGPSKADSLTVSEATRSPITMLVGCPGILRFPESNSGPCACQSSQVVTRVWSPSPAKYFQLVIM